MKKEDFLLSKKIIFLFVTFFIFSVKTSFSQCTDPQNPEPTGSSIQNFCKIENKIVDDLVASGGNIVWFDALTGGNQYTGTELLLDGIYYADDLANNSCSTSRFEVTVNIYGEVPTNVDVFVGKCASENPTVGDLSATGDNIEWYDAQNDGNLINPLTPLEDGKQYWVQQTENGCTSKRLPTTVTIVVPPPPTVETTQLFCQPPTPTVADLQPSGDVAWYNSETSNIPLAPSTPLENNKDYWATQIVFPCESIVRIKTTVQLDQTPYAGEDTSIALCESELETSNLFELLGGMPHENGTWEGPSELTNGYLGTFDPNVNVEGVYTYTVTSENCPEDSAQVDLKIITVPPPTINQQNQSFCITGEIPTVGDLTPNDGSVLWFDAADSNAPIDPATALIHGNKYWGAQFDSNSGCNSKTRIEVTVTLDTTTPNAGTNNSLEGCESELIIVDLFSLLGGSPDNNGEWTGPSTLSGGYLGTFDPDVNAAGDYTYTVKSEFGVCPEASATVSVIIITVPPPTINQQNQSFCETENATIADLDTSTTLLWYDTETSTTPLNPSDLLQSGDYWAAENDTTQSCVSKNRVVVDVIIEQPVPPTTNEENQIFCANENPVVSNLSPSGATWYDSETQTNQISPTEILQEGKAYWTTVIDSNSTCQNTTILKVTVTLNTIQDPIIQNNTQTFCASDEPTIGNLQASGSGTLVWYASASSTNPLDSLEFLEDGEDYWVELTSSGCTSSNRAVVTVTLADPGTPVLSAQGQEFCHLENPTINDLNTNVTTVGTGNIVWYDAYPGGSELSLSETLIDGETYYAIETDSNNCASVNALAVTVNLSVCDNYDIEIYDGFSPSDNGVNETFKIKFLRELYPDFEVEFYNRWGKLVYTANASKSDWNGRLNGDGILLPTGVYYFIIYFNKDNKEPIQRRLYLSR